MSNHGPASFLVSCEILTQGQFILGNCKAKIRFSVGMQFSQSTRAINHLRAVILSQLSEPSKEGSGASVLAKIHGARSYRNEEPGHAVECCGAAGISRYALMG